MRKGFLLALLTASLTAAAGVTQLHCSPTDDESVVIVTDCDVARLRAEPSEQTTKLYFETANRLRDRATDLEKRLTDLCNSINREVGLQEAADVRSACAAVANRLVQAQAGKPDAGGLPVVWVRIAYSEVCALNTQAQAECASQCRTAPCDPAQACGQGTATGTCAADCTGRCVTKGDPVDCQGACRGACLPGDAGPANCVGECVGECGDPEWTGGCGQGCDIAFVGNCGGTCTGTCGNSPIGNPDALDAGPDAAGPVPAPGGSDGNCQGICRGACSSNASGACAAPCRGGFKGGSCSSCDGVCASSGEACLTTCRGSCVASREDAGTCAGQCVGTCSAAMTNASCETSRVGCEANDVCKNVCAVRAATEATCEPPLDVDVRVAGDFKMYEAMKKHAAALASIALEAKLMDEESARISNVRLLDFQNLGSTRDAVRACVREAGLTVGTARTSLAKVVIVAGAVRGGTPL